MAETNQIHSLSVLASRLLVLALVGAGCRAGTQTEASPLAADPPPPAAPVVAVLSADGPIAPEDRHAEAAAQAVRIVEFSPEGEEQSASQIFVRFSQPMRPDMQPSFEIQPPVPGSVSFVDAFTLAYSFSEDPPPATALAVRVRGDVVSMSGTSETIDLGWTFATPRPTAQLHLADQYGSPQAPGEPLPVVDWNTKVVLTLSRATSTAALRRALSVQITNPAGDEKAAPYRLIRDPHDLVAYGGRKPRKADDESEAHWFIRPIGHWPSGSVVRVEVDASLETFSGPLSIGEAQRLTFETDDGVTAKLRCNDDFKGGCSTTGFSVHFDHDVPIRQLRRVKVTPRPKNFDMYIYDNEDVADAISLRGDFKVGTTYTVALPPRLTDVAGQPLASSPKLLATIAPPSPTLRLTDGGTLMGSSTGTLGIETRYLESVDLDIDPLTDSELADALLQSHPRFGRMPTALAHKRVTLEPHGPYQWDSQALPLADLLGAPAGAALVRVRPGPLFGDPPDDPLPAPETNLFQLTELGVFAGDSPAGSFVRVARLVDAKPVAGARASLWKRTPKGVTKIASYGPSDANGLIQLPHGEVLPEDAALLVKTDNDSFGLSLEAENRIRSWRYQWRADEPTSDRVISRLITERNLYQPGESVRVIGWLATGTLRKESRLSPAKPQKIEIRVLDHLDQEIASTTVRSKPFGKYWATLRIPDDVALGNLTAEAKIGDETFSTYFKVREFKTPSFVVAAHVSTGDVPHGEPVIATAQADYLHGMGVPLSKAQQRTRCTTGYFRPPGSENRRIATVNRETYAETDLGPAEVELDDDAKHGRIRYVLDSSAVPTGDSSACSVSVTTYDGAHEAMGASAYFTVHPTRYLMLSQDDEDPRAENPRVGERIRFLTHALDYRGNPIESDVAKIEIFRVSDDDDSQTKVKTCRGRVPGKGGLVCAWTPSQKGRHVAVLRGTVDGAEVEATESVYVRAHVKIRPPDPDHHQLAITPPAEAVLPGDEIRIALESPEMLATGLVVRSQGGIRATYPVEFRDHRAELVLRADPTWVPTQYLDLLTTRPRTLHQLPTAATTEAKFSVRDTDRRLEVEVAAPEAVGPGDDVEVKVSIKDGAGSGVRSHVAVWAVDEAILALAPWNFPDLVSAFAVDYGPRAQFIEDYDSLRWEYTPRGDPLLGGVAGGFGSGSGSGFGSGHARGAVAHQSVEIRGRFETTPIFVGDVETGPDGIATVRGRMPENLTTFRIAAIASAGVTQDNAPGRFGIGEGRIQVTSPFSVRSIVPSVLRPGDRSEVSAMVNNMTDKVGKLEIRFELVDAEGVLVAASKTEVRRTLSSSQLLVPLAIEAKGVGSGLVRAFATLTPADGSPVLHDAMEVPLRVVAERTLIEHAAIYGSMPDDGAIAVDIDRPTDVARGSGKLELSTHSSLLGGYQDNVKALVEYPYGCVEQTSTRLVPLLALGDLAKRYPMGVENTDEFVLAGLSRLSTMQTQSGGFAYWSGGRTPHFYATAYATWVLSLAAEAGHPVRPEMLDRARGYLAAGLAEWSTDNSTTPHEDARIAMAMHALAVGGKLEKAPLDRMIDRFERIPTFAQALVILAAHEHAPKGDTASALLAKFSKRIDVREAYARTRPPTASYGQYFDTPIRTDALALLVYVTVDPDSPVTEKLARGLASARDRGQLRNTQENAYALVAMAAYSRVAEKDEPAMLAQAWVDDARVLDAKYAGRTFDFNDAVAQLRPAGPDPRVTLSKAGAGRLYYRVGMEWSLATMPTDPKSSGIVIEKHMYADGRELLAGQSVAAGTQVTIDIEVTVDSRRDYIVVEVPIAAGLTPIDTSLGEGHAATGAASRKAYWVDNKELRADRIVLFADSLLPGKHRQQISLRATTPGRYSIPPARAEGMYTPEIYGFTAGDSLTVTR